MKYRVFFVQTRCPCTQGAEARTYGAILPGRLRSPLSWERLGRITYNYTKKLMAGFERRMHAACVPHQLVNVYRGVSGILR